MDNQFARPRGNGLKVIIVILALFNLGGILYWNWRGRDKSDRMAVHNVLAELDSRHPDAEACRRLIRKKVPLKSDVAFDEVLKITESLIDCERSYLRIILEEMRVRDMPARLVRRAKEESDPYIKGRLIGLLSDNSELTINALLEELDDKRVTKELPLIIIGWPDRVCDVAYRVLAHKLENGGILAGIGNPDSAKVRHIPWRALVYEVGTHPPEPRPQDTYDFQFNTDDNFEQRDEAITALEFYYKANLPLILKKLQRSN